MSLISIWFNTLPNNSLGICLSLMFAGPTLLHLALDNQDKPLYVPLL
ncbi:DUF6095 family protein, partial [Winogradskyella eximia]